MMQCLGECHFGKARKREREIHYVHSASLAYEDGIVFMSEPFAARQWHNGRQFSGPCAT